MQNLYKYRPFSPLLFKELKYRELYFSSYTELNDPLDLSARIDYSIHDEVQADVLLMFLFKKLLILRKDSSEKVLENNRKLSSFVRDKERATLFKRSIFDQLVQLKGDTAFVFSDIAEQAIHHAIIEHAIDFKFDLSVFFEEVTRLTRLFLLNSHVICFSETHKSFLMWAHYAASHQGVCLEFTLNRQGKFPYEVSGDRAFHDGNYGNGFAQGTSKIYLFEDNITRVNYTNEVECINFFDFSPVFSNEHDADLRGLSKSRWHGFAYHLQSLFSNKTADWEYEKEWRAIEINFDGFKEPEERIRHYPIEALTTIYFGYNMPGSVKNQIHKLYKEKGHMHCLWKVNYQIIVS